jgi:hypothetical protein
MHNHLAGSMSLQTVQRSAGRRVVAHGLHLVCPHRGEQRAAKSGCGCHRIMGCCLSAGAGQLALVCRPGRTP